MQAHPKGTVLRDCFILFFSSFSSSWSYWRYHKAVLNYPHFVRSYFNFKMTLRCWILQTNAVNTAARRADVCQFNAVTMTVTITCLFGTDPFFVRTFYSAIFDIIQYLWWHLNPGPCQQQTVDSYLQRLLLIKDLCLTSSFFQTHEVSAVFHCFVTLSP